MDLTQELSRCLSVLSAILVHSDLSAVLSSVYEINLQKQSDPDRATAKRYQLPARHPEMKVDLDGSERKGRGFDPAKLRKCCLLYQ